MSTMPALPDDTRNESVKQFTYGKIIQGGLDKSGYARIAQSTQLPDEATIQQIRDRASVGQVHDLASYGGSIVAFLNGPFAIAARFQRSPKKDSRGYFLQEHYLLLPRAQFTALGNHFSYLIDRLPPEIPWREQAETLPLLPMPQRNPGFEQQQFQEMWAQRREQLWYVLQLALDDQRFALSATLQEQSLLWRFFSAVSSLLPAVCRAEFSWGYNILNLSRNQSRLKVITGNPAGSEGFLFLNLANAPESHPLAPRDDNTRSYLTNLREYEQRFGWQAMLALLETMPCPLPGSWSDMSYHLAISLWGVGGATILGHQLSAEKRPYSANFLANIQAILDQPQARLSDQERVRFITAVLAGCLDDVLPVGQSGRLPQQMMALPPSAAIWEPLTRLFCQAIPNGQREKANAILKIWQQNSDFWLREDMQQFLFIWQKDTLITAGYQTESALRHLTHQASLGLTPMATAQQVQLLAQALQSGQNDWPQSLLSAWIAMTRNPQQAVTVAQQLPPLEKLLWHNSHYAYISWGLQGSSNDEIDRMIKHVNKEPLYRNAPFLLLLAQKGMQWQLPGFTAGELLLVLDQQADSLPKEALEALVSQILQQPSLLTPNTHQAVSLLLLSLARLEQFAQLVQGNKNWIDLIVLWQDRHPFLDTRYHQVMGEARKWFDPQPAGVSYDAWLTKLKRVFEYRAHLTRNTPHAVNVLAEMLLNDAFAGYTEESKRSRFRLTDENKKRVDVTVEKIWYVRETLFPIGGPPPAQDIFTAYLDKLGIALATWSAPRLISHLIKVLDKNRLTYEARHIQTVHLQRRGGEILREIDQVIRQLQQDDKQEELEDLLQEVESLSASEMQALLANPQQRVNLRDQVRQLEERTGWLARELRRFGTKLQ